MNKRISVLAVTMVLQVSSAHSGALFESSAIVSVQTSEIADPVGDARAATKADADVIRASIARRDRELVFTLTLAALPTNSDVRPKGRGTSTSRTRRGVASVPKRFQGSTRPE